MTVLKGEKTLSLEYSKDRLTFSNFFVWYKYKAASQQLLDRWKKKRMTGLRFSWKIENPPLMTKISEVGRSIQTPNFGNTLQKDTGASSDRVYKAILSPPRDLLQQSENGSLVIELNMNLKPSDQMSAFTNYKLYNNEKKSWFNAELHCKREGGQLASINSPWEQTLAEKAAEGNKVYLSGRKSNDQWQWADNLTWGFTNWQNGRPRRGEYVVMFADGRWYDSLPYSMRYFLCQGPTVTLIDDGLTRMELEKQQLTHLPLYLMFKSNSTTNTSSKEERNISGFTLNWFLKDSNGTQTTEKLPPRQEGWRPEIPNPAYKDPLFQDMVKLAMELRLKNMNKGDILKEAIIQKLQRNVISDADKMCSMGQVKREYKESVFSKFRLVHNTTAINSSGEMAKEDIEMGYELFHAVAFCPPAMVFKLYTFVDQLLSNETSRTVIQTIIHLLQNDTIADETTSKSANHFYHVLASILNLQYGNILLATSTEARLQDVIRNFWPFFTNHTDIVQKCLQESNCSIVQGIIQKLGMSNHFFFFSNFLIQLPTTYHERCPSTRST